MSSRMRRPETVTLHITRGDWLLVKKHLTAGEQRQMFKRMLTAKDGTAVEPISVGLSKMVAYLLDWSITDADDKPVVIRDQPDEVIASALDNLDVDSFREIRQAIEAHDEAMDAAREAEKNDQAGESTSSPISSSASEPGGDTNGSMNLTQMSIAS
jgi:hypothetical protein